MYANEKWIYDHILHAKNGKKTLKKHVKNGKSSNFQKALKIANKITPVPGGVGPMTIACLMHNTVKAAYSNKKHDFINVLEGIL